MNLRTRLGLAVAIALASISSHAALVTSQYTHGSGNDWTVDLTVTGDGTPAQIAAFTVYFDETLFDNLVLLGSAAGWDTIVVQPQPAIPFAGFVDAQVIDPADALASGQSAGSFRVGFEYIGAGAPGALDFEIYDPATFDPPLASGSTTVVAAQAVPEPGSLALAGIALGALVWQRPRRRSAQEVAA